MIYPYIVKEDCVPVGGETHIEVGDEKVRIRGSCEDRIGEKTPFTGDMMGKD